MIMSREITTVVADLTYLECPRWYEDRIWFVDFYTYRVLSATADGGDLRTEAECPDHLPAWDGCPTGGRSWCRCAMRGCCAARPTGPCVTSCAVEQL